MTRIVPVAAAVIVRDDGAYLLGQRPAGSFYAGYWEFPGGKVETGEQPQQALVRELYEELNIRADAPEPWLVREHVYEHAHVRLHFFRVRRWRGRIAARVHSRLHWHAPQATPPAPMLPANAPVLRALTQPSAIGITCASALGIETQLQRLQTALSRGLRCVHVREPQMDAEELRAFAAAVRAYAAPAGARVMLHTGGAQDCAHALALARELQLDGVHLAACHAAALRERPSVPWCSAAAHNRDELRRAATLGCDYAFFSPVLATPTHPHATPLGWGNFAALAAGLPLPVYALGGVGVADLPRARAAGAHGIAAIRDIWRYTE